MSSREPVPTPAELQVAHRRIRSLFSAQEPAEISAALAPMHDGRVMLAGTSQVALQPQMIARASGLFVPASAAAVAPLDLIGTYIPGKELFGQTPSRSFTAGQLQRLAFEEVLGFIGGVLGMYRRRNLPVNKIDLQFAEGWLKGSALTRAKNLLRDRSRRLVAPQALYVLAKLAAVHSPDDVAADAEPGLPVAALFGAVEELEQPPTWTTDGRQVVDTEVSPLSGYLLANQHLNQPLDEDHLFARFVRQWRELPVELSTDTQVVDLGAVFADATGVQLDDIVIVALALWARTMQELSYVPPDYFSSLGWCPDRLDGVLRLIATDPSTMRAGLQADAERDLAWAFDTLERYPVLRLEDGSLLVVDPQLLLRRVFGGLLLYDITDALKKRNDKKAAARADACVRHLAEVYALEELYSVAGSGPASSRVFGDEALRRAFARPGRRIADAAVDYGDAWVVVEVTTSKLKRESVAASAEALSQDLDKLIGEVEQIDSTIAALREEEPSLTGAPALPARRFYPLLVVAEGFPVNPVSTELLRRRALQRNLLTGPDVAPLEVIDTVELAMLEGLAEQGGPSMRDVLADKENAALFRTSLRSYLLQERRYDIRRSERVDRLMNKIWDVALYALRPAEGV